MAEVLPNVMAHNNYQQWAPPDEKDAYIGWLKGEFAAANAIIDSMCHHMRTIGSLGEYDAVFDCLSRRRRAWTPSLYMQQFYSIAEVVNSLQEVAWQKHQAQRAFTITPSALPKACPLSKGIPEDENNQACMKKSQDATIQLHQVALENIPSRDGVNGVLCLPETGDLQACNAPCNGVLSSDEEGSGMLSFDEEGDIKQGNSGTDTSSSTLGDCFQSMDKSPDNQLIEPPCDQARSLDTKGNNAEKLISMGISLALDNEDTRVASIKRSLQFQCFEQVDGQMVDGESAELCENVFSDEEVKEMAEIVHQLKVAGRQGDLGRAFRTCEDSSCLSDILQFGYKQPNNGAEMNESQPLPDFIQAIIKWLTRCGILPSTMKPDSCCISIFEEGDFVPPNKDQGCWEKPLCAMSILGDCTMVFGHSISTDQQGVCEGPNQVTLPTGSVLLLPDNFAGIFKKAVPASPSRCIIIALGKAESSNSSSMELNCPNSAGKGAKNRPWAGGTPFVNNGAMKLQGRPTPLPLHPLPPIPHHQFPSIQPIFSNAIGGLMNPYMPHPAMAMGPRAWARPQKLHNAGTGVFFPSCDLNEGVSQRTWQSGLLVLSSFARRNGSLVASTTGLDLRRARKWEKHAGQGRAKGSFGSMDTREPKKNLGKHVNNMDETCQNINGSGCGEGNQAS